MILVCWPAVYEMHLGSPHDVHVYIYIYIYVCVCVCVCVYRNRQN